MELQDYAELKINYVDTNECAEKIKLKQNFGKIEEADLVHKLAQSANSLMVSAGFNEPLTDVVTVIEWSLPEYKHLPRKEEIGYKFLITLSDSEEPVTTAIWNGESFDGFKNEEVKAWAYMPARYDDTNIWY